MSKLISTKGRYAMRLMLDIALYEKNGAINIKDISDRQDISPKYLEAIISNLNHAGLVRSVRGPRGGYILTKRPEEYTVGVIIRAVEGDLSIVPCVKEGSHYCSRFENCTTVKLWAKIDDALLSVIDNITLADMISWEKTGNVIHIDK
ncbi:MAG: Rrf2 family transcriptional regulator [Prevotella sp.]